MPNLLRIKATDIWSADKTIRVVPGPSTYRDLAIAHIDDEKMVIDRTPPRWLTRILSVVPLTVVAAYIDGSVSVFTGRAGLFGEVWSVGTVIVLFPSLLLFGYWAARCLYSPVRVATFDRLRGTVELPAPWFRGWSGRQKITIDFEREAIITLPAHRERTIRIKYPDNMFFHFTLGSSSGEGWDCEAFLIWYMDRNRPLPPCGAALDPRRGKDRLRRQGEGFPVPLYPASVDLPDDE